jgi:hypothetical protein
VRLAELVKKLTVKEEACGHSHGRAVQVDRFKNGVQSAYSFSALNYNI